MAGYIGNKSSVVSSGAERKFKFTITETTTTLSNLAYTRDLVHVFHNGVRLVDGTDYTATNGTSITLANAAENGDEVVVVSYASFQPSDTVSASLGGFFEGNVTVNADLTVSGNTDINGGTIDGTVIGGSTPAAISGTTGTFSGNLTVDTNTLFVDAATNEVGIGTTAPDGPLTVQLAASSNTSWSMALEGFNTAQLSHTISDSTSVRRKLSAIEGFVGSSDVSNFQGGLIFKTTPAAGSPTERVRIDAIGNMGIGTTSIPVGSRLKVSSSDVPAIVLINGTSYGIRFGSSSGIGGFVEGVDVGGVSSYQPLVVGGSNLLLSTNGVERMRIDSTGNVTKPYQPMFLGYPTLDYSSGGMPPGVMSITAYYNNGGHFNAANARFTAPVTGFYLTTWGGLQLPNTVTSLMINGTRFASGNHGVYTGSYITMTQTAIVSLNAGDYLNIEQWNGGGYYSGWYLWSVTLLG